MTQELLQGIKGKQKRCNKYKEEYVKENALLLVEVTNLRNQVTELTNKLNKRGWFSRMFGG